MTLSVAAFLGRFSVSYVRDLIGTTDGTPGGPIDEARVQRALDDAAAELAGWVPRLPEALRPAASTLDLHQLKVATYLLGLNRPGKEFEAIRNAYTDTIEFYRAQVASAAGAGGGSATPIDGSAFAPPPQFTDAALKGFV